MSIAQRAFTPAQELSAKVFRGILDMYGKQAVIPPMMQADIIDYYAAEIEKNTNYITRSKAIEALHELVHIEIEGTKQENTRKYGMTKKLQDQEFRAVRNLFAALTGSIPANEEVEAIIK